MRLKMTNLNEGCNFHYPYDGGDLIITKFQERREFVVSHNANIKPVSYFVGRETELKDLRQRIEDGRKAVLISGMGGIGKTHICRKLFEEYIAEHVEGEDEPFQHIGYIEYSGDMDSSLQNCLKFKRQENPVQNREAVWRELEYLASDGKMLLIVDNVYKSVNDDPSLLRLKGIPGAVILTSRQSSFGDEFETYRIGSLSIVQCMEIYRKVGYKVSGNKVSLEEVQDLEYIIKHLTGQHTITIEYLAHLAWTKNWTIKRLRDELEQKGFCLEFNKNRQIVNIQKYYETQYDLSALTKAEQNILEAFSLFPYIPLTAEVCNQWLLDDAGADDDILPRLYQNGWLQFDIVQESYSLHPVFARFIYGRNKISVKMHHGLIEACKKYIKIPESGSVLECKRFLPFAENIFEKLDMDEDLEQISFISEIAYALFYMGEYNKAEKYYERGLRISKVVLADMHSCIASIYNNLSALYWLRDENIKARELLEKGIQIKGNIKSYYNLATYYWMDGERQKAENLYKKIVQIRKKVLIEEHPYINKSYIDPVLTNENYEEHQKVKEFHEKNVRTSDEMYEDKDMNTAITYDCLAGIYGRRGKYQKAEELFKRSLGIKEKVL